MSDDTHDMLMKKVLDYLATSEKFERRPSERSKRSVRRELRQLMSLAKKRQEEIISTYEVHLGELRNRRDK